MAENRGRGKATWRTPKALAKDFAAFVEFQKPHKFKELVTVRKIKPERDHIKHPKGDDYEWVIEEQERLSRQGIVTIVQFAAWKGLHRTTITTNYSEGKFKDVYQNILAICEAYAEQRLYDAERNANNIIFAMKNSYGWVDETKHDVNNNINVPLSDEAKSYLAKATRADKGDDGASET